MGTKKCCEDCGKPTEGFKECRCNSCQNKWLKKQEEKMGKIFSSEPEEKKPNVYQIRNLYFNNGYNTEGISNLTGIPKKTIKEILGIDDPKKDGDGINENDKKRRKKNGK